MKRTLLVISMVMAAGCQSPAPPVTYNGGSFMLAQCGYAVTSRDGASAPVMGSAMLGSDGTPWGLHLGIAGDPSTSMVVSWRTTDETTLATTVQYGLMGKTDQSTDGLTFGYEVLHGTVRIHETHLCGLVPNSVYSYRAGGKDKSGTEKWSPVYTFHTGPDKKNAMAQVTIGLVGDSRAGEDVFGQILTQLQATATPDLILFSGDAILLGDDQSEWETWFKSAEPVLRQVPILSALGNHENNAINYYAQFALPGDEENYGINYGPLHLTVLNDSPPKANDFQAATTFLGSDLTANESAKWKFVMHHQPMFTAGMEHGSNLALRALWEPLVDQHKVDLVLNGHNHDYERTKFLRAGQPQMAAADGTTYLVAGGAGAPLYASVVDPNFTAIARSTYNFAVIKVTGGNLDMKAYDMMGNVIDMMTVAK